MPSTIELHIQRLPDGSLTATLRAYGRGITVLTQSQPITISEEALRGLHLLPDAYGAALSAMVFPGPLREAWGRASGHAETEGSSIHLRVLIDDPVGELHTICWELLRDPLTSTPLARQESGSLARLIPCNSLHDPAPPPKPNLRALVAVAGPSDAEKWNLTPVGVASEAARVQTALGSIPSDLLADAPSLATLVNIKDGLRSGAHILYLISHGKETPQGTVLYLVSDDGRAAPILGADLEAAITSLDVAHRPLLSVLVACESGSQDDAPLASVGPLLARAGIPAVIAMQATISMEAAAKLTARLLRELTRDGRIDRALAAARAGLGNEWWVPVLWLRARDGRLWDGREADSLALLRSMPLDTIPSLAPLPPGSRMLFRRNPLFVGRENDLRALAYALTGGTIIAIGQVAAATGLGGIGKTNLATEFVYHYGQFFAGGVYWLSFADPAAIASEVIACGGMGLIDRPDWGNLAPEEQVRLVRAAWEKPIPRLLVFDNCDDTDVLSAEELLRMWCPVSGGARILITSRRGIWDVGLGMTRCALGVLARQESVLLLHRLSSALTEIDADVIAATVGDLPLALHLSGSFLAAYQSVAPADYVRDLHSALLAHPALEGRGSTYSPTDHERHVARTFALSYDRLDPSNSLDKAARMLLDRAARLAPGEPIPHDLLVAMLTHDSTDALLAEDGLRRLVDLGLLDGEADHMLRLHRLLAFFVQHVAETGDTQASVEHALLAYSTEQNRRKIPMRLPPLQPHLRHITAIARQYEHPQAPDLCASLGEHLYLLGNYAEALLFYEYAVVAYIKRFGPSHAETLQLSDRIATLYHSLGDVKQALSVSTQSLALREATDDSDTKGLADNLQQMGEFFQAKGDYLKARSFYERALELRAANLGEAHHVTLTTLNSLTLLLVRTNRPAAELLFARAQAVEQQLLADSTYNVLIGMALVRSAFLALIRHDVTIAEQLLERARIIWQNLLDTKHPDITPEIRSLLATSASEDEVDDDFLEHGLVKIVGEDHPIASLLLALLGAIHHMSGELVEARYLYEKALSIQQRTQRLDQRETAQIRWWLGILLAQHQDRSAARAQLRYAVAIYAKVSGRVHPMTKRCRKSLYQLDQKRSRKRAYRHT